MVRRRNENPESPRNRRSVLESSGICVSKTWDSSRLSHLTSQKNRFVQFFWASMGNACATWSFNRNATSKSSDLLQPPFKKLNTFQCQNISVFNPELHPMPSALRHLPSATGAASRPHGRPQLTLHLTLGLPWLWVTSRYPNDWMINTWLVVYLPSEKYESQLGWWHSQYMEK